MEWVFPPRIPSAWSRVSRIHTDPGQRYSPGGTHPISPYRGYTYLPHPGPKLMLALGLNSTTSSAHTSPAPPEPKFGVPAPVLRPTAGTSEGCHPYRDACSVPVRGRARLALAQGEHSWQRCRLAPGTAGTSLSTPSSAALAGCRQPGRQELGTQQSRMMPWSGCLEQD